MKDAQKPDHMSLNTLVSRLKEGRFVIPDFQRDVEWEPWDMGDLVRSIFLDYYIGSLLLWKSKPDNFAALSCEPLYGYQGTSHPEHIVLDGQQRLTAIYYTMVAPAIKAPKRANRYLYFIQVDRFIEGAYDQAFEYLWTSKGPKLLENEESQFASHMFPLSVVGKGGFALAYWIQDYIRYWQDQLRQAEQRGDPEAQGSAHQQEKNARAFGEYLKVLSDQYQVSYIELDRDLALDRVCDIFTQINSRGIRLDVFDLVNALLRPKGLQLKDMWRRAEPRLDFVETERMNVYVLQVMSILRQVYCSPKYLYYLLPGQERALREADGRLRKEVLVGSTTDFERLWTRAIDALVFAIDLLRHPQEFGVISSSYLPYVSILPAFASLQSEAHALPAHMRMDAQRKVRHWYWASVFTNRYSGSVESTTARDFQDVKTWFEDDTREPLLISEFKTRFRSLDLRNEVRRGTSVYNGIFNLFVIRGARDWMTGNVPQHGDLDDHHVVPKDWGKKHGVGRLIDSILNRVPLTADTNRNVIGDRLPNSYLSELQLNIGEETLRTILDSHYISPVALDVLLRDPFTPTDFDVFLDERQRTIQEAIGSLLVKERIDLSPDLRDLDEKLEKVELSLRELVAERLLDDPSRLPMHIRQKIREKGASAARKNPALDWDEDGGLLPQLEYTDLRELQDTITSKMLWVEFEGVFKSKETLANKFNQLAELRNCLRHSRTVDEITRKEGEAALIWFEQVLAKR